MATAPFTDWIAEVQPQAPDCPRPLVVNAIRNAVVEFCNTTNWWQGDFGTLAVTTAILPYDIVAPITDAHVAQVMSASYQGTPLDPTSIEELDAKILNWRAATGQPRAFFQTAPAVLDFYPRPAGTDSYDIFIRLAYTPLRAATGVDDSLREAYLEEIAAGALSRLLAMPNKPWTDMDSARRYEREFGSAMVLAAIEANKSYGRPQKHIQLRKFE